LIFIAVLVGWPASQVAAGYGKKATCPVRKILVKDVSIRHKKGVEDPEQILSDYTGKLEQALQKAGFVLVESEGELDEEDVSLEIVVRAWISRATSTGRITQELGASVSVHEGNERVWTGEVGPGEASLLWNLNNSNPKNLAKQTAKLVARACGETWTTP
jgi:hypothetical protein